MKVFLSTLGCKLNESELESWTRQFAAAGNEIVDDARNADLCIVNTCTVTQVAASKSRALVKRVTRANGEAKVVLTGCYATMSPDQARSLPNVALLVPNSDKDRLVDLAGKFILEPGLDMLQNGCRMPEAMSGELEIQSFAGSPPKIKEDSFSLGRAGQGNRDAPHPRTRAFVKIEDGCNMSCTYCIIPLARGKASSRRQDDIVQEVADLVNDGYNEVILTGVQISDYRLEERETGRGRLAGLCSLVRDILDNTGIARLRLTSIAPWDLDEGLLGLFDDARICRHLHLSLQSGSATVLRRMRRPYSPTQFADAVGLARSKQPDIAITTDVIVGFPGESDAEFYESLEFVERMEFARVHVFPYSPRAGTIAARLPLHVTDSTKDIRAKAIHRLAVASADKFASKFLGRTLSVLYEAEGATPGIWSGYSDNYVRVTTRSDGDLTNRIFPTTIEAITEDGALGTLAATNTRLPQWSPSA